MSQVDQAFLKAYSKGRLPLESPSTANPSSTQATPLLSGQQSAVAHTPHAVPSIHVSQTKVRQSPSASVSNTRVDAKHIQFASQQAVSHPMQAQQAAGQQHASQSPVVSVKSSQHPVNPYTREQSVALNPPAVAPFSHHYIPPYDVPLQPTSFPQALSPQQIQPSHVTGYAAPSPFPLPRTPIDPLLNVRNDVRYDDASTYATAPSVETPTTWSKVRAGKLDTSGSRIAKENVANKAQPISLKSAPASSVAPSERITLRSYFEQAKPDDISIKERPPINAPSANDVQTGYPNSPYANPAETVRKPSTPSSQMRQDIPTVASRFHPSVAIHPSHIPFDSVAQTHLFSNVDQYVDPVSGKHQNRSARPSIEDSYPAVHRNEQVNPWHGGTIERSIKATADSSSVAAKVANNEPFTGNYSQSSRYRADDLSPNQSSFGRVESNPTDHHSGDTNAHWIDSKRSAQPQPESHRIDEQHDYDHHDYDEQQYASDLDSKLLWSTKVREEARPESAAVGVSKESTNESWDTESEEVASELPVSHQPASHQPASHQSVSHQSVSHQSDQHIAPKGKVPAGSVSAEPQLRVASPLQPVWEVDSFLWPAIVAKLLDTQKESFQEIGLHLQHAQSKGLKVVSITAGERGVGRSTVALCLAKTIARTGLRVAVVDADYECPSLVDQLNLEIDHGWQGCLLNNIPLEETGILSLHDNICLFPLTESLSLTQVSRHETRIQKLIKRISNAFDMVILDGNRLNQKQYQLLGAGKDGVIDAAIVIVDSQLSLQQRVDTAVELVKSQGIQSIGLAENFHS